MLRLLRESYCESSELTASSPETLAVEYCLRAAAIPFQVIDVESTTSSAGPLPVLRSGRQQISGFDCWFEALSRVRDSRNRSLFLEPTPEQSVTMRGLLDRVQLVFNFMWKAVWLCFPGVDTSHRFVTPPPLPHVVQAN